MSRPLPLTVAWQGAMRRRLTAGAVTVQNVKRPADPAWGLEAEYWMVRQGLSGRVHYHRVSIYHVMASERKIVAEILRDARRQLRAKVRR